MYSAKSSSGSSEAFGHPDSALIFPAYFRQPVDRERRLISGFDGMVALALPVGQPFGKSMFGQSLWPLAMTASAATVFMVRSLSRMPWFARITQGLSDNCQKSRNRETESKRQCYRPARQLSEPRRILFGWGGPASGQGEKANERIGRKSLNPAGGGIRRPLLPLAEPKA
jgi:hypothetical protein